MARVIFIFNLLKRKYHQFRIPAGLVFLGFDFGFGFGFMVEFIFFFRYHKQHREIRVSFFSPLQCDTVAAAVAAVVDIS